MTALTATTSEDGTINVSVTNGIQTVECKGKGMLRTIIKASIWLWMEELAGLWESI